jgi:hypothetical protein
LRLYDKLTNRPGFSDVVSHIETSEDVLTCQQLVEASSEMPIEDFDLEEAQE